MLTQEIVVDGATYTLQIIQDRTVEQQTLQIMLAILLVGGLVVIVVAFGFGTVYARRALVPIRDSLAGQRVAAPPPARVRCRRQPRAADATDRHPQQRRATSTGIEASPSSRSAPRSWTSTTRSAT